MELPLFEQVGELTRTLVDVSHVDAMPGPVRVRSHRRGVKMWFGGDTPERLHFEAQLLPDRLAPVVPGEGEVAVEVGFHAELKDAARNQEVLDTLAAAEKTWRAALGPEAELGPFIGRDGWGRLSETWIETDLEDPDVAFELASRLADYVNTIGPLVLAR
ncbi:MAG: hypothetical protein AAF467_10185 [Actinomycetota bacterium]